jgi:hypothetical protein
MATRQRAKKVSHPLELQREVYALMDTRHRLQGIAYGLHLIHGDTTPIGTGLRHVLRKSIMGEAHQLGEMADRLNELLGDDRATINGGA